jgi:hypothetical protein
LSKTTTILKEMDNTIKVENLFWDYYSVTFLKDSYLKQDLLSSLENWILPEKIVKFDIDKDNWISVENLIQFDIVKPSLVQSDWINMNWEEITWGINKIWANLYQDKLHKEWKKIKVWVIDTGVNYNHSDFDEWKNWYDFVDNDYNAMDVDWHWTHVAWTIGAIANWKWIYWVNSNVEIISLRVLNDKWYWNSYDIGDAIVYAAEHWIDVVNVSIGVKWNPAYVCEAVNKANKLGLIVVASAWNDNVDLASAYRAPSNCNNVITVWAVNSNLKRASFSNYWEMVDISAPWVRIKSTLVDWWYGYKNWTSMATPHVTW